MERELIYRISFAKRGNQVARSQVLDPDWDYIESKEQVPADIGDENYSYGSPEFRPWWELDGNGEGGLAGDKDWQRFHFVDGELVKQPKMKEVEAFLGENGVGVQVFGDRQCYKNDWRYKKPLPLDAGDYELVLVYADDCHTEHDGAWKIPPTDPLQFEAYVCPHDENPELLPVEFQSINHVSNKFTVGDGYSLYPQFGFRNRWPIKHGGGAVKDIEIYRISDTKPVKHPPVTTAFDPNNATEAELSEYAQVHLYEHEVPATRGITLNYASGLVKHCKAVNLDPISDETYLFDVPLIAAKDPIAVGDDKGFRAVWWLKRGPVVVVCSGK